MPVTKVGAVLLCLNPPWPIEVVVLEPYPKRRLTERAPLGLVRGTRAYWDGAQWVDADRDGVTLPASQVEFEPVAQTMRREVAEEAGISETILATQKIEELGVRPFASKTKGVYPIHWFVVLLDDAAQAALPSQTADTKTIHRMTLQEFKACVERGEASLGYVPIIEEAMQLVENRFL